MDNGFPPSRPKRESDAEPDRPRARAAERTAEIDPLLREVASHDQRLGELRRDVADLKSAVETLGALVDSQRTATSRVAPRAAYSARTDAVDTISTLHAQLAEMRADLDLSRKTLEQERMERLRLQDIVAEGYKQLKRRVVASIEEKAPAGTTIVVVSKGDEELVRLNGRRGWHFPQAAGAVYAGHYPVDGASAVTHLEELRSEGAQYLVFPATARWWLDHYPEFADHLARRYRRVFDQDDIGVMFDLRRTRAQMSDWRSQLGALIEEFEARFRPDPAVLDCHSGLDLAAALPRHKVFSAPDEGMVLPYLDGTVDVVVCGGGSRFAKEARRVASTLFITTNVGVARVRRRRFAVRLESEWLVQRPSRTLPTVSIIIPCHNGAALTEACLRAVDATLPASFRGEILVVDDASTDGTGAMLARWQRRSRHVKVLTNARNLGFLRSCNRAARAARGAILVLLNNDTRPCRGWLTALLRTFHDHPDTGAVGGKLVFPNGTLQEAGGLVFRDGSALHFGRGDRNPDHPLFNYVRPVDYCSAALLATPRRLFLELGGFDAIYQPAYYEDADYCFKVWDKGLRVYYQPAARVVHHEGASCGTDVTQGVKRHQVENHGKFRDRWRRALEGRPERPPQENLAAWQRLAVRPA